MTRRLFCVAALLLHLQMVAAQRPGDSNTGVPPVTQLDVASSGNISSPPNAPSPVLSVTLDLYIEESTTCLWLRPHRFRMADNIVMLINDQRRIYVQLLMRDGKVGTRQPGCSMEFDASPLIREWHHICITLTPSLSFFYNGNRQSAVKECNFERPENALESNETKLIIGGFIWNAVPFSGFLADIRIFGLPIRGKDVASLAAGEPVEHKYLSINQTVVEDKGSFAGISFSEITTSDLLEKRTGVNFLYFKERFKYGDSKAMCGKLGGRLVKYSAKESQNLAPKLAQYIIDMKAAIDDSWVDTAPEDDDGDTRTCAVLKVQPAPASVEIYHMDCNTVAYVLCEMQENRTIKVLGLEEDNILYPIYNTPGIFESREKFRLTYNMGVIKIQNVITQKPVFIASIEGAKDLMGRHALDEKNLPSENDINLRYVAVSSCEENQFTCSDGICVDLAVVCDSINNCHDSSDELFCLDNFPMPSNYAQKFSPAQGTTETAKIGLRVTIEQLVALEHLDNTLVLSLKVDIDWKDPRIDFMFLQENRRMRLPSNLLEKMWLPSIMLDSAIPGEKTVFDFSNPSRFQVFATATHKGYNHVIGSHEVAMFEGEHTKLYLTDSGIITFTCEMRLLPFPCDVQICKIPVRLNSKMIIDAVWDKENTHVILDDNFMASLFHVEKPYFAESLGNETAWIVMKLSRNHGAYVFTILLPCVLVEMIGLLTHMFPIEDFSDRVNVTLACFIVKAAFFVQVSSTLPTTSEPKLIDIWMFGHVGLLFLVFTSHVLIKYLDDKYGDTKQQGIDEVDSNPPPNDPKGFLRWIMKYDDKGVSLEEVKEPEPVVAWIPAAKEPPKASRVVIINRISTAICAIVYMSFLLAMYIYKLKVVEDFSK